MARFCKHILLLTYSVILLASCQEGGDAGELLGQWRLADGDGTKYVSFSGNFVRFMEVGHGEVYGNFTHTGDSIFIRCYSVGATPADTALVEQVFGMKPFADIRLKAVLPDDHTLLLSQDGHKWALRKY